MLSFNCILPCCVTPTCCTRDVINLCLSNNSSANAAGRSEGFLVAFFVWLVFWHMQINCYAGAVGLPVWTGGDSWSAAAQVIRTAHSKQSSLLFMPQIHTEGGHWICVNYSYGNDNLFLVAILLKYRLPGSNILSTLLSFFYFLFYFLNSVL